MTRTLLGHEVSFGLQYNFRNPPQWRRPWDRVYAETLHHIAYAEQLGFDFVWTSEHHFLEDGYSPSVLPICAAISVRTTRVRIGTQVLLAPFYDPLRLAEDAATVDIISGGRFELGLGQGYRGEEFDAFGVERRTRGRRLEEIVSVLRGAWGIGPFTFTGWHFQYQDIDVTPKPLQQPIPIWAGATTEAAARRAARFTERVLATGPVAATFLDERNCLGEPSERAHGMALVPWALIADDPDAAWATIGDHVLYQRHAANHWLAAAGRQQRFVALPQSAAEGRSWNPDIVVTPIRAREIVEQAVRDAPTRHVSISWWAIPPGVAPEMTYRSMELFADAMLR